MTTSYKLVGGADKPYPRSAGCGQDCHLGPQYSHARTNGYENIFYPSQDMGSGSGFALVDGIYPPETLVIPSCKAADMTHFSGQYWPGFYTITSGSGAGTGGALPAIVWKNAQQIATATISAAGSGYSVGDLYQYNTGSAIRGGVAAILAVTSINGSGGVTGVRVKVAGQYKQGYLPSTGSMTKSDGVTPSPGTGASFSLTFTNAKEDLLSTCQQRGFKSVCAQRNWHGTYGFFDRFVPTAAICFTPASPVSSVPGAGWGPAIVGPYLASAPTTKYRTQSITVTTYSIGQGTNKYTSDFTVSATSGENTGSGTTTLGYALPDTAITTCPNYTHGGILSLIAQDCNSILSLFQGWRGTPGSGDTFTGPSGKSSSGTFAWASSTGVALESFTLSYGASSASAAITYKDSSGALTYTESWNLSNTHLHYEYYNYGGTGTLQYSIVADNYLTDANAASDVIADAVSLLSQWDLTDDKVYPPRLDGFPQIMPMMTRNETPDAVPLVNYNTGGSYVDPMCNMVLATGGPSCHVIDGTSVGAPLPAGHWAAFSPIAQTWGEDSVSGSSYCQQSWGNDPVLFNYSNNTQLPMSTTQWTDPVTSLGVPPGASWMSYGAMPTVTVPPPATGTISTQTASFRVVKYMEIIERWPAQNWNYAGDLKFAVDMGKIICSTGGNLASAVPAGGGLYAYVIGGGGSGPSTLQGIYHFAAGATTTASGTLVYNAPSNWWDNFVNREYSQDDFDIDDFIAPLRVQASSLATAPSLAGRAAVTLASGGGPYNYTWGTAQPAFGMMVAGTESVDVFDKYMNSLATNVTATRVLDYVFQLANSYPTAAWVMIHGDPNKWYMNTNYPRGNYAVLDWVFDNRTPGEIARLTSNFECDGVTTVYSANGSTPTALGGVGYFKSFLAQQHCLDNRTCAAKVVCITPNSESFPNGMTFAMTGPAALAIDQTYGSQASWQVMSTMTDEYWQGPSSRCDGNQIYQDDGSCGTDMPPNAPNSPLEPLVECELITPTYGMSGMEAIGSIPAFVSLGFIDPTSSAYGVLPPAPGSPVGPWQYRGNLMGSVGTCTNFDYGWFLV